MSSYADVQRSADQLTVFAWLTTEKAERYRPVRRARMLSVEEILAGCGAIAYRPPRPLERSAACPSSSSFVAMDAVHFRTDVT